MQTVTARITLDLDIDIDPYDLQTMQDAFISLIERAIDNSLAHFEISDYNVDLEYT